jgi:photosystem II stability/assembly factor-like uncharacterized protein
MPRRNVVGARPSHMTSPAAVPPSLVRRFATPLERTRWFAARAGSGPEASSARRLAAALAQPVPIESELPRLVVEAGLDLILRFFGENRDLQAGLVDAQARVIPVRTATGQSLIESVSRGPVAFVTEAPRPWAFLGIRLPQVNLAEFGALRLVCRQGEGTPVALLPGSGSSAAERLVIGIVTSAGDYQAALMAPSIYSWQELGPVGPVGSAGNYQGGIGRVAQVDIHPTNGQVLIAGAAGGGVWRTDNGGTNWRPLMDDDDLFINRTLTIGAVAFAPSDPAVMYAASGEDAAPYDPAWPGAGVYRSSDGGGTWPVAGSVESTRFSAIAVHPHDPSVVYAAGNRGLHKSVDGGVHWSMLWRGRITDVIVDPDSPDRVYIGVYRQGIHRSTTAGQPPNGGFTLLTVDYDLDPEDHGYIKLALKSYGAGHPPFLAAKFGPNAEWIYTSTDAGDTWTKRAPYDADNPQRRFAEWTSVVAVNPDDVDELYAGQRFVLRRSVDGGGQWSQADDGLHPDHQDLVFDPVNRARIYLANDAGVYRSDSHGDAGTWQLVSGDLNIAQLYDLDISQQANSEIVACGAQESGIFYRDAAGWRNFDYQAGGRRWDGTRVAIDAADPNIVYFSGPLGITHQILSRTLDGGLTIQPLGTTGLSGDSPFVTILTLDPDPSIAQPETSRIIFLGGSKGLVPHLFRSQNAGQTWKRVENAAADGTLTPFVPEGEVSAIEFAPSNSSIVYLGTSLGAVYRTTQGGATPADWERIDNGLPFGEQVAAISAHPSLPDRVWVVFAGDGVTATSRPDVVVNPLGSSHVFRGIFDGTKWRWTDASGSPFLPWSLPDVPTSAVIVDKSTWFEVVYVGTDVGVYMTWNGGWTWMRLHRGLPRVPITRLRLHLQDRWLYAATMGRGAFRRQVDLFP